MTPPWFRPLMGAAAVAAAVTGFAVLGRAPVGADCPPSPPSLPPDLFFAVVAPPYSESSGGTTVLHALVDRLNRRYSARGEPSAAFVVPWGGGHATNPGYASPLLPPWLDPAKGVVVYPEIIEGNPLKAPRVVRWMLYFPGLNGGPQAAAYDGWEDMVACYMAGFCSELAHKDPVYLRVSDHYPDYSRGLPSDDRPRKGTIYFARKTGWRAGNRTVTLPEIDPAAEARARGAFLLDPHEGKRRRLELFSRAAKFVTRDPLTYRAVEAASVGCPAVVEKVPGVTKEEWLATAEDEFKYGIAYGEEDLPWAKSTLNMVKEQLMKRRRAEDAHLDEFVRRVLQKWYSDKAGPAQEQKEGRTIAHSARRKSGNRSTGQRPP
ncbi:hypothetical protein DFJ74DRAFT_694172 [Hyaloraphidium curvatum]|nr:hypothetical protein DFJ74DRAFT_694172 [Hyaloraphidium curvatum]